MQGSALVDLTVDEEEIVGVPVKQARRPPQTYSPSREDEREQWGGGRQREEAAPAPAAEGCRRRTQARGDQGDEEDEDEEDDEEDGGEWT